jgi:hypothetical protein
MAVHAWRRLLKQTERIGLQILEVVYKLADRVAEPRFSEASWSSVPHWTFLFFAPFFDFHQKTLFKV